MVELDRTEARIVGVLIEKQFTVPDTYPLTENALVAGCNQKSNRDPEMSLEPFEVAGALMALHGRDLVARVEGGGRVAKYRHLLQERLDVSDHELAVLAELLLRGPQAPGALKPRVARMGFHGTPGQIEDVLRELAAKRPALVSQLPKRPRERDQRWGHLFGGGDVIAEDAVAEPARRSALAPAQTPTASSTPTAAPDVLDRLEALEQRVAELEARLDGRS